MRPLLILLLALVVGGSGAAAAALTVNTARWESDRVAAVQLAAARAAHSDARADAVAERERLSQLTAEGDTLLAGTRTFLALTPGWADAAALTALATAADALEQELVAELPPVIRAANVDASLDDATRAAAELRAGADAARAMADDRAELMAATHDAVATLARSAVSGGGASIAALDLATEELRDAARSARELIGASLRANVDSLAVLADYSTAWAALNAAHVEAKAAADAAAAEAAAAEAAASSEQSSADSCPFPGSLEMILSDDGTYFYGKGYECYRVPVPPGYKPLTFSPTE